jgi:hypothetical protein
VVVVGGEVNKKGHPQPKPRKRHNQIIVLLQLVDPVDVSTCLKPDERPQQWPCLAATDQLQDLAQTPSPCNGEAHCQTIWRLDQKPIPSKTTNLQKKVALMGTPQNSE